jgi:hypothetical protein
MGKNKCLALVAQEQSFCIGPFFFKKNYLSGHSFTPDWNEVVVEDDESQEVEEEVGLLAVDVVVVLPVVAQHLASDGRHQRHEDQDEEESDDLKHPIRAYIKINSSF